LLNSFATRFFETKNEKKKVLVGIAGKRKN